MIVVQIFVWSNKERACMKNPFSLFNRLFLFILPILLIFIIACISSDELASKEMNEPKNGTHTHNTRNAINKPIHIHWSMMCDIILLAAQRSFEQRLNHVRFIIIENDGRSITMPDLYKDIKARKMKLRWIMCGYYLARWWVESKTLET